MMQIIQHINIHLSINVNSKKFTSLNIKIAKNTYALWGEYVMEEIFHIGIDIGSTTVKIVVLNSNDEIVYKEYKRHYSDIKKSVKESLSKYI